MEGLRAVLYDTLRAKKIITRQEVWDIADNLGYTRSNAERRMRYDRLHPHLSVPAIPCGSKGKPIYGSEPISFWKWAGPKKFKEFRDRV